MSKKDIKGVSKFGIVEKSGELFKATLTKEVTDRDGEIVDVDGVEIENYRDNNVLIDAHNMSGSVVDNLLGGIENIRKEVSLDGIKRIVGDLVFADSPRGQIAKGLVQAGFAKTLSIGFKVLEREGERITKSELYETSLVLVPSNVGAMIGKSANLEEGEDVAEELLNRIKNYEDIHPKIKEFRKLFLSKELVDSLGYVKSGNELEDIHNIFELVQTVIKSVDESTEETNLEEEATEQASEVVETEGEESEVSETVTQSEDLKVSETHEPTEEEIDSAIAEVVQQLLT